MVGPQCDADDSELEGFSRQENAARERDRKSVDGDPRSEQVQNNRKTWLVPERRMSVEENLGEGLLPLDLAFCTPEGTPQG